jgi:methylmalonyl-CoA/ethylmalonyl-CoA epimerase
VDSVHAGILNSKAQQGIRVNEPIIDHIGIAVQSVEVARRFFGDLLKLDVAFELDMPERGIKIVMYRIGDAMLETIEIDTDAGRDALGSGLARLDHIAVRISNLNKTIAELRQAGVAFDGEPRKTSLPIRSQRAVYGVPDTTAGISIQFIETE